MNCFHNDAVTSSDARGAPPSCHLLFISAPEDIILYKDPVLGVRDNSLSDEEEICDSVELDILDQLDIDEEETDDRIERLLEARRGVDDPADSDEEYHK